MFHHWPQANANATETSMSAHLRLFPWRDMQIGRETYLHARLIKRVTGEA